MKLFYNLRPAVGTGGFECDVERKVPDEFVMPVLTAPGDLCDPLLLARRHRPVGSVDPAQAAVEVVMAGEGAAVNLPGHRQQEHGTAVTRHLYGGLMIVLFIAHQICWSWYLVLWPR